MAEETGVVDRVEGEYAMVKASRSGGCDHCASKSMCSSIGGTGEVVIQAFNTAGAKPGDTVKVEIPAGTFLMASVMIYIIPIVALIIGGFIGSFLHPHFSGFISKDALSAVSALFFLVLGVFLAKFAGRSANSEKYTPKVIEIIG